MKISKNVVVAADVVNGIDVYDPAWWEREYDDISDEEVRRMTDQTPEEFEESLRYGFEDFPGYRFKTFMSYNGDQDIELYDLVMLCETPSGDEFLAQFDDNGRLLDVTPEVYEILGYADRSGYYLD